VRCAPISVGSHENLIFDYIEVIENHLDHKAHIDAYNSLPLTFESPWESKCRTVMSLASSRCGIVVTRVKCRCATIENGMKL
jgi:hypothetical protein